MKLTTVRKLEAIAVEGYRTGALTESQVRRSLGLEPRFTAADLEDDLQAQLELRILPRR